MPPLLGVSGETSGHKARLTDMLFVALHVGCEMHTVMHMSNQQPRTCSLNQPPVPQSLPTSQPRAIGQKCCPRWPVACTVLRHTLSR